MRPIGRISLSLIQQLVATAQAVIYSFIFIRFWPYLSRLFSIFCPKRPITRARTVVPLTTPLQSVHVLYSRFVFELLTGRGARRSLRIATAATTYRWTASCDTTPEWPDRATTTRTPLRRTTRRSRGARTTPRNRRRRSPRGLTSASG